MDKKGTHYRLVAIALCLGIALCGASAYALHATSTTQFCLSCHEMQPYEDELRFSAHAKDKDGKAISCGQCHIPAGFGPRYLAVKTYSGIKDLFVHTVFSPGPGDLKRVELQAVARRFIDDANCLNCHEDLYKDAKGEQPISDIGKLSHDAYLNKNGNTKSNCAGCHINMAHLPGFDRRLNVNKAFTARIQNQEALR